MLKRAFNPNGLWPRRDEKIEGFLIPFARHAETGQVIRLPSDRLREGDAHYDHAAHKGKLKCPCCDARVHFNKGNPLSGGGNLEGQSEHFHTNPKQHHEDACRVAIEKLAREDRERDVIDPAKGFVINLNMLGNFSRAAGRFYERRSDGYMHRTEEFKKRTEGMERIAIRSVSDFVEFLRTKSVARISNSIIVSGSYLSPWQKFCISNKERTIDLIRSLREGRNKPCLIPVDICGELQLSLEFGKSTDKKNQIKSALIDIGRDVKGRQWHAQIIINTDRALSHLFMNTGKYLVAGKVQREDFPASHPNNKSRDNIIFLNISIDDPTQVMRTDIMEIARENRRRHTKNTVPGSVRAVA